MVSDWAQKVDATIEEWRPRKRTDTDPYGFVDGLWLKRSWGGEVHHVAVLVAIGVNQDGFREVLAVAAASKEDATRWTAFRRSLKERGLQGVDRFRQVPGLVEQLGESFPRARWQRCVVHFYRNIWTAVPNTKVSEGAAMLKAIHAQEDAAAAEAWEARLGSVPLRCRSR